VSRGQNALAYYSEGGELRCKKFYKFCQLLDEKMETLLLFNVFYAACTFTNCQPVKKGRDYYKLPACKLQIYKLQIC